MDETLEKFAAALFAAFNAVHNYRAEWIQTPRTEQDEWRKIASLIFLDHDVFPR